jgi:hypothetical protein
MDYSTVIATKPGVPPPKVEKRTGDNKVFQIDCTVLLSPNEVIHGAVEVLGTGLTITDASPKLGKYVRFKAEGGPTDIPYADYLISFLVNTSNNSELIVPVSIRSYSI